MHSCVFCYTYRVSRLQRKMIYVPELPSWSNFLTCLEEKEERDLEKKKKIFLD